MCNKNIDNNCDFVLAVVVDLVTKGGVDNDSVPNLQRCVIKDQGQRKTSSINDKVMTYFVHCHQSLQGFPLRFNRKLKQICLIQVLSIKRMTFLVMVRS